MAKERILVPFEPEQLARIERFRRTRRLPTRVGAIRQLIDLGLGARDPLAAAIAALRDAQPVLAADGIDHASVFGSVARGEAGVDSDVDVLIDLAPDRKIDLFGYIAICHRVADLLAKAIGRRVDVVARDSLKERLRPGVEREAVRAF